jgi:type III secretion protein V
MGDAGVKYSILTIGDGMVTQIPALLGAMSAGLLVTRTSGANGDENLGQIIGAQMTAKPRVLLMAGGLCGLFALVPGFPSLVFVGLGLGFLAAGALLMPPVRARWERWMRPAVSKVTRREMAAPVVMSTAVTAPRPSVPLLLEVTRGSLTAGQHQQLLAGLERMLDGFQFHLGLQLPRIDIHMVEADDRRWQLLAYEVPVAQGPLAQGEDGLAQVLAAVSQSLRRHAGMFLGTQEASQVLTRAAIDLPDVVKETLRALPLARVAEVLRRLVEEEVGIRNMRDILETLSDAAQREKDVNALVELTRIGLKRQICHRVAPEGRLHALLLEPALEEALRGALRVHGGVEQLALDPGQVSQLMTYLKTLIEQHRPAAIVTAVDIRRHVRKLIEPDCFSTPVLSYHELVPSLQLEVLARLGGEGAPRLTG